MFSVTISHRPGLDWDSIASSLAKIWPNICEAAEKYLSEYPHKATQTDRLRIYIRPDSGMLHLACTGPKSFYGAVASVEIPYVERCYFDLPRDDKFDTKHDALIQRLIRMLSETINTDTAWDVLTSLCTDRQIVITTSEYDDDETERPLFPVTQSQLQSHVH
jgi:hypothetical protein